MTTILGLTGSIGMGKSTVARQFVEAGAKLSDADAIVHKLLQEDDELIGQIAAAFPQAMAQGAVDRKRLGALVFADAERLKLLEQMLHPKVRAENLRQIAQAKAEGISLLVLEIPLLYETGAEAIFDKVVVVSCGAEKQRERVLARPNMTEEKFHQILHYQMPDDEKCARADFVIDTSRDLEDSRAQVEELISSL